MEDCAQSDGNGGGHPRFSGQTILWTPWHLWFDYPPAIGFFVSSINALAGASAICPLLSAPLQRDGQQCSCDTPLYCDTFQEVTRSATPTSRAEKVGAAGSFSGAPGGVAWFCCGLLLRSSSSFSSSSSSNSGLLFFFSLRVSLSLLKVLSMLFICQEEWQLFKSDVRREEAPASSEDRERERLKLR